MHQIELFEPEISKSGHIGDIVLQANLKFLRDYAGVDMPKRTHNIVKVDKSDIKSGDFLAIIRISGLETMQVWGTGARTGHTAVAMWDEAGELWVMESTDKTNYWPNPNIQKTKWDAWIAMSESAQYNVVRHTSHLTPYKSHLTPHTSHLTPHTSHTTLFVLSPFAHVCSSH